MGVQIAPKNVIGRDALISRLWQMLRSSPERSSLRFLAERRVGKTTVIAKMAAEPEEDFDVLFLEVEGIDSCLGLAELLLERFDKLLPKSEAAKKWFRELSSTLGGTEIAGMIKLPETGQAEWQVTLNEIIGTVCVKRSERLVLLIFDELPYMLQKIDATSAARNRPHEALTLLDTFRALRQRHSNLRMIFSGSVGLHHVLRDLRQAKLAAEPVNNMPPVEILPLEDQYAMELAERLLRAENIEFGEDSHHVLQCLIHQTSNVPFYMERIASQLALLDRKVTVKDVEDTVLRQLTDSMDPWQMEHFRERLDIYYRGNLLDANGKSVSEATLSRTILDFFSMVDSPQSIDEVWKMLRGEHALTDRNDAVRLLKSLGQDHYLATSTDMRYSFRYPLVKRWWRLDLHRG